jgi:hypothetical protein
MPCSITPTAACRCQQRAKLLYACSRPVAKDTAQAVILAFTHPSHIVVAQARSALERAGIDCLVRNEYAGGAVGELAPIDAWPELWITRDRDYERAVAAIESTRRDDGDPDWNCRTCGHANPGTFDWCWSCAGDRYAGRIR